MSIKAVIFDCDGMINFEERFSRRLEQFVPLKKTLPFFKNEFQECLVGQADLKVVLAKKVQEWNWKGTVDDLLSLWFSDDANVSNKAFFPAIEILRAQGCSIYLATNNEKYRTSYLLESRGLGKLFDKVFSSSSVGYKKPQTEFYDYLFAHIPQKKQDVLYWDDDLEHIKVTRGLGIPSRLYTTFEDFSATMGL